MWLVVCSGNSIVERKDEIQSVANSCTSISVHSAYKIINTEYILIASNYLLKQEVNNFSQQKKLILTTKPFLNRKQIGVKNEVILVNLWTFLPLNKGFLRIVGDKIIGANITAGVLGVAYACLNGAKKVMIAGMDGYTNGKGHCDGSGYIESNGNLMKYSNSNKGILNDLKKYVDIQFITPSEYENI